MARRARNEIFYDGCFGHVYSRALERRRIFQEPGDFETIKGLFARAKEKYGFRIHHYCLMNTHFHLLVSMDRVSQFSKAMQEVKRLYADGLNQRKGKEGPVWWGRFGSQLIENEQYLYACGLYIEMNPVNAGLVRQPEDWPHSSAGYYSKGHKDELIDAYDLPERSDALTLMSDLNVGRGPVIGSKLFNLLYQEETTGAV